MKNKLIALFCMFLIITSSISLDVNSADEEIDRGSSLLNNLKNIFDVGEETGESIVVNVDSIEPTVLSTNVIENQNAPIYVYLKGSTLGSLLGSKEKSTAPLYGIPKIKDINLKAANSETTSRIAGYTYVAPKGRKYLSENGLVDLGYLVILLRRIPQETKVPDEIVLDFDADIRFDVESGIGEFGIEDLALKEEVDEQSWKNSVDLGSSFWGKSGYARASRIESGQVSLTVYNSMRNQIGSVSLKKGETSYVIYLHSGLFTFYDKFRIKLNDIKIQTDKAELNIITSTSQFTKLLSKDERIYPGSNWKINEIDVSNAKEKKVIIKNDRGEVKLLKLLTLEEAKKKQEAKTKEQKDKKTKSYLDKITGAWGTDINGLNNYLEKTIKDYDDYIKKFSGYYSVSPDLVKSVIYVESKGDPASASDKKAIGLMQLLLSTARATAGNVDYKNPDRLTEAELKKPEINIQLGTKYLSNQIINFNGDLELALASYNWGPGNVKTNCNGAYQNCRKLPNETKNYVNNVLNFYKAIESNNRKITQEETETTEATTSSQDVQTQPKTSTILECQETDISQDDNLVELLSDIDKQDLDIIKKKTYCTAINELKKVAELSPELENTNEAYLYLGKSYEKLNDYDKAIQSYSSISQDSSYFDSAQLLIRKIKLNQEKGFKGEMIYLEDEDVYVTLNNIQEVDTKDLANAVIIVGSEQKTVSKDSNLIQNAKDKDNENFDWVIKEINDNNVVLKQSYTATDKGSTETLKINEERKIITNKEETTSVKVIKIDTKQEAYISILPGTGRAISQSKFRIHVPIEKRPFSLSPDQIDYQINETRKLVSQLNNIINKLDNTLKVWKGVCIGTYAVLVLKSLTQPPVHVKARQMVMNGDDGKSGWKKLCSDNSGPLRKYTNYDECVSENSKLINSEIKNWESNYKIKVDYLKENEGKELPKDLDYGDYLTYEERITYGYNQDDNPMKDGGIIDKNIKFYEGMKTPYKDQSESTGIYTFYDKKVEDLKKQKEDFEKYKSDRKNAYTKAKETVNKINGRAGLNKKDLFNEFFKINLQQTRNKEVTSTDGNYKDSSQFTQAVFSRKETNRDIYVFVDDKEEKVTIAKDDGNKEMMTKDGKQIYKYDDKYVVIYNENSMFKQECVQGKEYTDHTAYYNEKGKPYMIPSENGNYIKILDYYSDGSPKIFEEWNVGKDGIIGNEKDCPITSSDVLNPDYKYYNQYKSKVMDLKARINNAGICKDGERKPFGSVNWLCSYAKSRLESQISQRYCSDFMDISDCEIIFNVCDPVMCPSSRFNFGGRWTLGKKSVAETGLIGSLVLGMPNWIVFGGTQITPPVCLTGISASLKGWRSVLQGYIECLQVSKTQDKSVGICDKVRSVFMCEMLWREALAMLDVNKGLLSLGLEALYGKNTGKGGGEYITFKDSLDAAMNSFSFFTEDYGQSAFAAYKARSTEEVGTQICKAAIFAKSPGLGKFFEDLTAPESPPQFTAYFDVSPYATKAGYTRGSQSQGILETTQEQSKYEIYYHIYAGEDQEVIYSVYLINNAGGKTFITDCSNYRVIRNVINKGEYVDKSCTIVDRAGYNQICVEINGRTECGFGKVSTGFGLKYFNDLIVKDEALSKINSTEECRPDNPTLSSQYDLNINLNKQYGLVNTGLLRVCNPTNPGKGTNENNWAEVGVCTYDNNGNPLSKCWLDKSTIDIKDSLYRKEVFDELYSSGLIKEKEGIVLLKEDEAQVIFDSLELRFKEFFSFDGVEVRVVKDKLKLESEEYLNNLKKIEELEKEKSELEKEKKDLEKNEPKSIEYSNYLSRLNDYEEEIKKIEEEIEKGELAITRYTQVQELLKQRLQEVKKNKENLELAYPEAYANQNIPNIDVILNYYKKLPELEKQINDLKQKNLAIFDLQGIQEIIKYKEKDIYRKIDEYTYRNLISVSPSIDIMASSRIRIGQAYYALGNLFVATKNTMESIKLGSEKVLKKWGEKESKETPEESKKEFSCIIEYEEDNSLLWGATKRLNLYYRFNNEKWETQFHDNIFTDMRTKDEEQLLQLKGWKILDSDNLCNSDVFKKIDLIYKEICDNLKSKDSVKDGIYYLADTAAAKDDDYLIIHAIGGKRIEIKHSDLVKNKGGKYDNLENQLINNNCPLEEKTTAIINKIETSLLTQFLSENEVFQFMIDNIKHNLKILKIDKDSVGIEISSTPIELTLKLDTETKIYSDMSITLKEIKENKARFLIKKLTIENKELKVESDQKQPVPGKISFSKTTIFEGINKRSEIPFNAQKVSVFPSSSIENKNIIISEDGAELNVLSPDLTNLLGNLDYNKLPVESVSYLQSYYLDKNKETTIKYSKVDPDLVLLPSESIDQIYDSSMKLLKNIQNLRDQEIYEESLKNYELKDSVFATAQEQVNKQLEDLRNPTFEIRKEAQPPVLEQRLSLPSNFPSPEIKENEKIKVTVTTKPEPIPPDGTVQIPTKVEEGQVKISKENKKGEKKVISILSIKDGKIEEKTVLCKDVQENQVATIEGSKYTCNQEKNCRENLNLGKLDCKDGELCCRKTCESAYSGYECIDKTKYNCEKNTEKKGYCYGGNEVVCCQKGSRIEISPVEYTKDDEINKKISSLISGDTSFIRGNPIIDGTNCAGYVIRAFNHIFGYGKNSPIGLFGEAPLIPENIDSRGGTVRWYDWKKGEIFSEFDSLNPGDMIGLYYSLSDYLPDKKGSEIGNTEKIDFTHIVLYLGKKNGEHYITHLYHVPADIKNRKDPLKDNAVRVESLEDLFKYYKEYFEIRVIIKPDQKKLYEKIPMYLSYKDYTIQEKDTLGSIADGYGDEFQESDKDRAAWIISTVNNIKDPAIEIKAGKTLKIPTSSGSPIYSTGNKMKDAIIKTLKEIKESEEWAEPIYRYSTHRTPNYIGIVMAIIKQESRFDSFDPFEEVGSNLLSRYGSNTATLGCMQLQLQIALDINSEEKIGMNRNKIREELLTKSGCIRWGVKYLDRIIKIYSKNPAYPTAKEMDYIFADYNSGYYASRNAAIQKRINEITNSNLGLDGDLLIYNKDRKATSEVSNTEKAIRQIFKDQINDKEIRKQLEKEKTKEFENTLVYKEINKIWSQKNPGKSINYAVIPEIKTRQKYLVITHTAKEYVQTLRDYYNPYCNLIVQFADESQNRC